MSRYCGEEWIADHKVRCAEGSEVVSQLALKVRPRYHLSSGRDVFYTRPPYLNKDLGAGYCPIEIRCFHVDALIRKELFCHVLACQHAHYALMIGLI